MASIAFTDSTGAATLTNGRPDPASRFCGWTPRSVPYGEATHRQSDMRRIMYRLGDMHGASFELRHIPVATAGGQRNVDIANRLIYHLLNGGTCAVDTDDYENNSYATCSLMPGTTPSLTLSDAKLMEFTLSLSLINVAGSPVAMVCHYAA